MDWLFASGAASVLILFVMAGEAVWLRVRERWGMVAILCRLMPGAMMMLALWAALVGQAWWWIALPLTLSFPFHLADLRLGQGLRAKR